MCTSGGLSSQITRRRAEQISNRGSRHVQKNRVRAQIQQRLFDALKQETRRKPPKVKIRSRQRPSSRLTTV